MLRPGIVLGLAAVLASVTLSGCGSAPKVAPGTASVVSAPVRTAHTSLGVVGYRVVGSGPPLVMIMGWGWTMEGWDPRLIHALAQHDPVVMFDNSGVGHTQSLPPPLTIDAMANQPRPWRSCTPPRSGRKITRISAPTLIADGTADELDPAANAHTLARLIPRARLVFYPDAGHAFLFQEGPRFASLVESFLTGHPSP